MTSAARPDLRDRFRPPIPAQGVIGVLRDGLVFARGGDSVRVETRFANSSREFVLEVSWADRPLETERFTDLAAFQARVMSVDAQPA